MGLRGAALLGLALAFAPPARAEMERPRFASPGTARDPPPTIPPREPSALRLHSAFEPNRGQADPSVSFFAKGRGCRLYLQGTGAILAVPRPSSTGPETKISGESSSGTTVDLLAMRFPGSRAAAAFEAAAPLPGLSHYLVGNDSSKWVRDVPRFAEAACRDLWPGVDLRWQVLPGGGLEYSFLLAPGADARLLAVDFEGQSSLAVDVAGDLVLSTGGGFVRHACPEAWQESAEGRHPVAARFVPRGSGRVVIELGPVDPALPVVVDPKILVSSYFGGTGGENGRAVAVDGQGRPVVAGTTDSTNLPLASAFQSTKTGSLVAFVSRLSADGTTLVSSTYLGAGTTEAYAVAADAAGAMYVGGYTTDYNFPVKNAFQPELDFYDAQGNGTHNDAFVTKLAASGSSLVWSTFLGSGGAQDTVQSMAVTSTGEVVVGGYTAGNEFPLVNALKGYPGNGSTFDGFLAKFSAAGNTLAWSTYIGGTGHDAVMAVSLAPDDAVCFAGYSESSNIGVVNAFQSAYGGSRDCMVGRIAANGAALSWFTYLGGAAKDEGLAVVAASDGGAFVVGTTSSSNFPMKNPLFGTFLGNRKAFVTRIGSTGGTLVYSTFLGGTGYEDGTAAVLESDGALWVAGATNSANFPLVAPLQGTIGGNFDAFLAVVAPDGSALRTSTYLGGSGVDAAYGLALPAPNTVWVCGRTNSANFPYQGGYDSTVANDDVFLASVTAGPRSPGSAFAELVGLTKIDVSWIDRSDDETAFVLERKTGLDADPGAYAPLATLAPGTILHHDAGLDPATTYTYRVKATGAYGESSFEVTNSVTTPPAPVYPPDAPSGLQATIVTPRCVDLAWTDNSDDEDFFTLARAVGPGLFATQATPRINATSYVDETVLPEKTYSWKVRAQNPINPSLFSNTVTVTMPSTLVVATTRGKITHKEGIGRDAVRLAGTFAYGADALSSAFDPSSQEFTLRLGNLDTPPLLNIGAAAPGWMVRKGKYTWKSPKGTPTKATVIVDTLAGTWSVKLSRLTLPALPANPVRPTLTLGTDTGHHESDWTLPTSGGLIKFPVPIPRR